MAVLVTGGAGYIGSHTCLALLDSGYEVVVIDNYSNSNPESLGRVSDITRREFPVYDVDLLDKARVARVFSEQPIDAVIHFAGFKAVGESVALPLRYYQNNIVGTLNLCDAMHTFGVKKLVFSSSATVYGLDNRVPLVEHYPTSALNPYGATKMMLERILLDVVTANPDWSVSLLRYFNPVGAHESGRIGEDPNGVPNNLLPYITQVAVGKLEKLTVYGNDYQTPDGTCIRHYIHVMDFAVGHVKALEFASASTGAEVFNLGTGQGYSVLEVLGAFEEACGIKIPYSIGPRRAGDAPVSYADPTKATNILGWRAGRSLVEMCRDAWVWQAQNPNGYA